jgi:L-threonylcarbamoyladenylate synthase
VIAAVLERFERPLAAPSANRFGRISPTAAQHVSEELDGRVPLILDAGQTLHGLESTIVAVRDRKIELLRRGPITREQLMGFGEVREQQRERIEAPGQLASHYAPRTRLVLVENVTEFEGDRSRAALLAWRTLPGGDPFATARVLSKGGDMREAAANLFRLMRELDAASPDVIVAEAVPEHGLGAAIMDRLRRAAA